MNNSRKRQPRSRPVPLDAMQTAVAIFAASVDYEAPALPTTTAARKTRTAKFTIKREGS